MIIAYAGRRPSGPMGDFPAAREEYLQERVERLLAGIRPECVIGSAAAGGDLIILEAACHLGIPATVVLGHDVESFAADSVEDKPGWRDRFDAVIQAASVNVVELDTEVTGGDVYHAVNQKIIELALGLNDKAKFTNPASEVIGLLLSAGSRGDDDYTEHLGLGLEANGRLVLRLDPKAGRESSPMAFVAMPFGSRKDPTKRLSVYESDPTWSRLLLPALLDAGYRVIRADVEASLQLIDERMVWNLFAADLVVADIATLNANVFWELGVRHTARRRGTLVVGPTWVAPPFDIKAVPIRQYDRSATDVDDGQLVAGLRMLKTALQAAISDRAGQDAPDSPVHLAVPSLTTPALPPVTLGERWLERIAIAAELSDADLLVTLVKEVECADLPSRAQGALCLQAASGLVRLGRHREAAALLRPLAEADPEYANENLQQMYAHALIRSIGTDAEKEHQLAVAEHRLRVLNGAYPGSGETLGLLGSAAKERAFRRQKAGRDASEELRLAGESYRQGFVADPTDYYPGVNAVVLLRILGQHCEGNEADLASARALLPVVRFAVKRMDIDTRDVWAHATLGELALQEYLLSENDHKDMLSDASRHYRQAAAHANSYQLKSMEHQLELMLMWGDPPSAVDHILRTVRDRMSDCLSATDESAIS